VLTRSDPSALQVGGFSYADTLDSAKGWAGTIRFNDNLLQQFERFYSRGDTFSLGICNGCQLMALLGWVPAASSAGAGAPLPDLRQPRFVHNASGRFESRWVSRRCQLRGPARHGRAAPGGEAAWHGIADTGPGQPDLNLLPAHPDLT
jgi:phosphoribosylformylglycinamidine synthase